MARGITNLTALSMRDFMHDPNGAMNDLKRWACYLPFGVVGWHYTNSSNTPVIATATTVALSFDTKIVDREGFSSSSTSLIVPKGLGGLYMMEASAYWVTAAATILAISVTRANGGGTLAISESPLMVVDREHVFAMDLLNEGDSLNVRLFNNSGGNITVTAFAGDALNPPLPFFKGYRVALL